ncbi:MAG: hypothetical protein LC753_11625 [Acidobacteria bacterium]|nr:hypothetical protein [Acidobacteriota bacterium]MCA1650890.1 hypothetical protein [Acidobacteriota bacterium]
MTIVRPGAAVTGGMLLAGIITLYAVLGLVILAPESVYSGDIGVKYVQAQALARHRFQSLDIPYPGQFLDPARTFFPLRQPFAMATGGTTQAIFPPSSAVIQAAAVSIAGFRGLIILSLLSAGVILYAAWRLAPEAEGAGVLIALGAGSPLWFYAISGWEHAPAVALGVSGFACAVLCPPRAAAILGGMLVGAGAALRDEVVLLLPGVLLASWLRERRSTPLVTVVCAAAVPLVLAATLDVVWFDRPVAAHLRHAVHVLQSAALATDEPNPALPMLRPFTLRERYETVVQYWLLGYGKDRVIAAYVTGLLLAFGIHWKWRSSVGFNAWLGAVALLACLDLWEVLTAPKWLAGLQRVSPYLVFALLPGPRSSRASRRLRLTVVAAAAAYLLLAFVGVDTTGGKSLGPRLLLPLLPLLAVAAVGNIASYLRADTPVERLTGRLGVALVAIAVLIHLGGTVRAYHQRNRDDASAVLAVAAASDRIVVADDPFTAQLLFPLYYRKIILLADSTELGTQLGTLILDQRLPGAILVSRHPESSVTLTPLRPGRRESRGRMSIQEWRR